jgi:hypothetical protein
MTVGADPEHEWRTSSRFGVAGLVTVDVVLLVVFAILVVVSHDQRFWRITEARP